MNGNKINFERLPGARALQHPAIEPAQPSSGENENHLSNAPENYLACNRCSRSVAPSLSNISHGNMFELQISSLHMPHVFLLSAQYNV